MGSSKIVTSSKLALLIRTELLGVRFPSSAAALLEELEKDSSHWAAFGRVELAELACDTNNLLERFFHCRLSSTYATAKQDAC